MKLRIFESLRSARSDHLLVCVFATAPLFLVTLSGWSSAILLLGAGACLPFLFRKDVDALNAPPGEALVIFVMTTPVLAVALSSLLRGVHNLANYDSPARFLVAIAIFLFILRKGANLAHYLQYTAPLSLLLTLIHQLVFSPPERWGDGRMCTFFADPLVFGYTSLTLGLMSLASIHLLKRDSLAMVVFKLTGAATGLYLSIMSGSRTGWLVIPVLAVFWATRSYAKQSLKWYALTLVASIASAVGLLLLSSTVQQRLLLGVHQVMDYQWVGLAPETSVGFRVTFLRIAADMFINSPTAGHGDNGYDLTSLPSHIYTYASPAALDGAFHAGFHNEIVSNAVRFGIGGLLASALLLLAPMVLFMRQSRSTIRAQRANAVLGLVLSICFFVSSLSTEVFDLKYMASFYAVLMAALCASAIATPNDRTHLAPAH